MKKIILNNCMYFLINKKIQRQICLIRVSNLSQTQFYQSTINSLIKKSMTTIPRPMSTPFKSRSFFIDKRSTISTRETSRSPSKSFVMKSKTINLKQQDITVNPNSENVPIELYFNPDFRHKYVKKVIDSFFVNLKDPKMINNPQKRQKQSRSSKIGIRTKMKQSKQIHKLHQDIEQIDSTKFIRSSPKKSILSEFSDEKSLSIIDQQSLIQLKSQMQNENTHNFTSNSKSISSKTQCISPLLRPYSVQNNRRQSSKDYDENKSINSVTVSVFFKERKTPRQKIRKELRKLIDANNCFHEYSVYEDGKLKSKLRKYTHEKNEHFIREDKIFKRGIKTLWKYSKFPLTLQYPLIKSIKQELSQQFPYGSNELDYYTEIYPKPYYNQLFFNNNEQLVDIITSMAKFIIECKGKVLTNGFNMRNLYKVREKQFYLKDLGCSAINESFKIREKSINHLYPPILRSQQGQKKWLIRPEYLSPQLLESYKLSDYSWIESNPDTVIASEVWSLGCMIFQILTLIPLNSDVRTRVKTNPDNIRKGFLSIKLTQFNADFDLLQRKQKLLQNLVAKTMKSELKNVPIQKKVIQVLKKMLSSDPKNRIKPEQIISQLKP